MSDFEYIISALKYGLAQSDDQHHKIYQLMKIQASTANLNSIRVNHAYLSALCVGCFSMFERAIQYHTEWDDFNDLCSALRSDGKSDLANKIMIYKNAVNVMKHGIGPSHNRLLEVDDTPPFRVRLKEEDFAPEEEMRFVESDLVDVDNEFAETLVAVLEDTFQYISSS